MKKNTKHKTSNSFHVQKLCLLAMLFKKSYHDTVEIDLIKVF
jgi:hypothetical protein